METSRLKSKPLAISLQALAAIFGGYLLASACTLFLSAILPLSKTEAVITASLFSFVVYPIAIIWVYAKQDVKRAWLGMIVPSVFLIAIAWLLSRGVS